MMKPGSGRRTRSPGAGLDAAHGPQPRTTNGPPGPALLRHRGHGRPVGGDQPSRGVRRACGAHARPGGLASLAQAFCPGQHHAPATAPRSPELNPVENVWQFVRDNWLSNRIFGSYEEIVDHGCEAWNKLIDQPWIIMSIGLRDWAD